LKDFATVTVLGKDRTGAVAAFTNFLFKEGGNIEGLVEQVNRREFHMTLSASWQAAKFDRQAIAAGLKDLGKKLDMEVQVRFASQGAKPRMAILVTKELHCLETLMAGIKSGKLKAEPVVLMSNHPEMEAQARRYKLPFVHADFKNQQAGEAVFLKELEKVGADFVVLARFMKILSPSFAWRYKNRIINIHPSLLPAFPGASAYRQAYDHGVKVVGVTSHFVTPDLDGGPIIVQDAIRLKPNEPLPSIIARGQKLEAKVLMEAVKLYLVNRLDVHWGKVAYV
jgi:formyltetrahydrofolate deformylase